MNEKRPLNYIYNENKITQVQLEETRWRTRVNNEEQEQSNQEEVERDGLEEIEEESKSNRCLYFFLLKKTKKLDKERDKVNKKIY